MTKDDPRTLGERAYQAYAEATSNKNFLGSEMPMFYMLPEQIQAAWNAAADCAFKVGVQHANKKHRELLDTIEKELWP